MSLVERTLDSGLIVSQYGGDHASIERELRKRDPDLSLLGEFSETHDCIIWKVILNRPDRPWETVYVWASDLGEPYPLSSGILDGLDRHDRNTRSVHVGEDELNDRRAVEQAKQRFRESEAHLDDYLFKHGHPITPRSVSLRMKRDKRRARGEKL